ncbi:hypothetical protein GQX74_003407 [Glossina fuscipes]|nr:hypothetical protein GQX74_003407 [Glossina fuscipes]
MFKLNSDTCRYVLRRHRVTGSSTLHVFVCESIDDNDYNSKQSSLLSSSLLLFKCLSVCASIKCLVALTLQCAVLTRCTCQQHIIDMWLAVRRRGTAKKSMQEPKYGKRVCLQLVTTVVMRGSQYSRLIEILKYPVPKNEVESRSA